MFSDYLFYMKMRFDENKVNRKKKSKKRIRTGVFQKTAIIAAGLLWCIAAGKLLWAKPSNATISDRIINTFDEAGYTSCQAGITAYGKYGNVDMTDTAKSIILENIAETIGISKYTLEKTVEDDNDVITLGQSSQNGDVICKFITYEKNGGNDQYIYMGVTLNNGADSAFTYEKKMKEILDGMEIDATVTVNLKGEIPGCLDNEAKKNVADMMIAQIGAKKVLEHNDNSGMYMTYAYDKSLADYVSIGKDRVNINITITYDEVDEKTIIYLSTPINNNDY